MPIADGIVLGIVVLSCLLGFFRGFVAEIIALVSWILAFFVAQYFYGQFAPLLLPWLKLPLLAVMVAWILIFVVTLLVCRVIASILGMALSLSGVGIFNRFLGAAFGVVRATVIVLALVVMLAPYCQKTVWWNQATLPNLFLKYEWLGQRLHQEMMQTVVKLQKQVLTQMVNPSK
jgi:membrane protein required for colicin V production